MSEGEQSVDRPRSDVVTDIVEADLAYALEVHCDLSAHPATGMAKSPEIGGSYARAFGVMTLR